MTIGRHSQPPRSRPGVRAMMLVGCLAVVALVGGVAQYASGALSGVHAVAVSQRFVALSLVDPTDPPRRPPVGNSITVSFRIDNLTGAPLRQAWSATLGDGSGAQVRVGAGTVAVPTGAAATRSLSVTLGRRTSVLAISAPGSGLAPLLLHFAAASR